MLDEISLERALVLFQDKTQCWKVYFKDEDVYRRAKDFKWRLDTTYDINLFNTQFYMERK